MNEDIVAIKGIKNGLLVELSQTEEWLRVTNELAQRIDARSSFFAGAKITVDLGSRPVPKHELTTLKALQERRDQELWAVETPSDTTIDEAHALDLKTNVPMAVPGREDTTEPSRNPEEQTTPGVMIKRTLRSGRSIHSDGHVVVFGDVNPGAQIVAQGDVVIWGRLRGTVHAGAGGDENAVVCALDMTPTQLRIAGHIVVSPDDKRRKPKPEVAVVRNGGIVVEAWR